MPYHCFLLKKKKKNPTENSIIVLLASLTPQTHFTASFSLAAVDFRTCLWGYCEYHHSRWSASCVCRYTLPLIWNIWMKWPLIWLALVVFCIPHPSCSSAFRHAQVTAFLHSITRDFYNSKSDGANLLSPISEGSLSDSLCLFGLSVIWPALQQCWPPLIA